MSRMQELFTTLLEEIGEDPTRDGLKETPARMEKTWKYLTAGYRLQPSDVLKEFVVTTSGYMVGQAGIRFHSLCEHHLVTFWGVAHVAYIPTDRVVGLSKLHRLVDIFARRLQVQERMTDQIADALDDCLKPKGVGVMLEARHMCIESRGVKQVGSLTTTTALRGAMLKEPETRAEFLQFCHARQGMSGAL